MDWLGLWRRMRRGSEPLRGAPPVRRLKSYSAESGYVYQYFYEGYRGVDAGTEYVFQVSADRKSWFAVTVRIPESSVAEWGLSGTERYAVAKMALFQAFDERAEPGAMREAVVVRAADAAGILEKLGRE